MIFPDWCVDFQVYMYVNSHEKNISSCWHYCFVNLYLNAPVNTLSELSEQKTKCLGAFFLYLCTLSSNVTVVNFVSYPFRALYWLQERLRWDWLRDCFANLYLNVPIHLSVKWQSCPSRRGKGIVAFVLYLCTFSSNAIVGNFVFQLHRTLYWLQEKFCWGYSRDIHFGYLGCIITIDNCIRVLGL